jgi:hypothetical protein
MTLTEVTLATLRATFASRDHRPSVDHWAALHDVASTLEAMSNGTAKDKVYLSAIDCGVGKSSTALAFARSLITSADPAHVDVGMIICVNRKREADNMAHQLADLGARVVVLTGDTVESVTAEDVARAQLLITTQQRVEQALDDDRRRTRPFADLETLYYRGAPRQVRVHDEAFLPGEAINLGRDVLGALLGPARRLSVDFNSALDDFMVTLKRTPLGGLITIPDWTEIPNVSVNSLLQELTEADRATSEWRGRDDGVRQEHQRAVKSLFFLAGRSARVWQDNQTGASVLAYRDTLPVDMKPMLVLDASGRVRQTYRDMKKQGLLVPLRPAVKDYAPLTIHWWKRGGGKAAFYTGGNELAKGIAETIAQQPDEDWLVVHHKPSRQVGDVERMVRRQLPRGRGQVSFCNWGNHLGTNEYGDVGHVILAGTLFMSLGHDVALTHLCKGRPMSQRFVDPADAELTQKGETADGVLQAISRGRVRKSDGKKCQPMQAYIIATSQSGMADILAEAFPGSTVVAWDPLKNADKSKAKAALDFVDKALADGQQWVPYAAIREAIKVPDKTNFRRDVLNHPTWKQGLLARRLEVDQPRGRPHGLRRAGLPVAA